MRNFLGLLAVSGVLGLAACAGGPPPDRPQVKLAFAGKERLAVPASRVEFIDSYKPVLTPPHVEQDHAFRPTHLVRMWLNERLQTSPSEPGKVIVEITDASVVETPLETEGGLRGAVKQEPERAVTGRLNWIIRYDGPEMKWKKDAYAEVTHTIPEQATLNQADKAYNQVIEDLADHLDRQVEVQINSLRQALQDIRVP